MKGLSNKYKIMKYLITKKQEKPDVSGGLNYKYYSTLNGALSSGDDNA